jgi:hypothetical protein
MCRVLEDGSIGVAGGKVLYPDGRTIQHAGGVVRWPQALPDHWGHGQPDDGRWDTRRDVDYVTGATWGFRREMVEQVGELDEGFWPGYYEDTDFCYRAREGGWRVVYVPEAKAVHLGATSLGAGTPSYVRAIHQGRLRFALKHLAASRFLDEFVPAERAWLAQISSVEDRLALVQVYRLTLRALATFAAGQMGDWGLFRDVAEALVSLRAEAGRMGGEWMEELISDLEARKTVQERPFRSDKPLVGPLIAWFRTAWNSVSTRWYVLPLLQQQNLYNESVAVHLEELNQRLIVLDREQTALVRDMAELTYQYARLRKQLEIGEVVRD